MAQLDERMTLMDEIHLMKSGVKEIFMRALIKQNILVESLIMRI